MKIHNNNFLKNLGPTPEQMQKAFQADLAAKGLRTESEIAAKMRELRKLLDSGLKPGQAGPPPVGERHDSSPRKQDQPGEEGKADEKDQAGRDESPGSGMIGHIDIRV